MPNEEQSLKPEEPAGEPKTGNPVEYLLMPLIKLIDLLNVPVQKLTGESGYLATGSVIILFLIAVSLILRIPQEKVLPLLLTGVFILLLVWLILYFTTGRARATQRKLNTARDENKNLKQEIKDELERYSLVLGDEISFLNENIEKLKILSNKLNESEATVIQEINEMVDTLSYRRNDIQEKIRHNLSQATQGLERSPSFGERLDSKRRARKQTKSSSP
jgi:ABC-type multidrug transport system fused ATPase/permease subunit